jgi:cyanophycin synthetase
VKAAVERNIPWLRLNEQSLIQLGQGKYQQRIQATVTGPHQLHRGGAGAGQGRDQQDPGQRAACRCRARNWCARAESAVRAAERLGYPVVTKPYNGNHGRGISDSG